MDFKSSLKKYSKTIEHFSVSIAIVGYILFMMWIVGRAALMIQRAKDVRPIEELMQEQVPDNPPAIKDAVIIFESKPIKPNFDHARQKEEELMLAPVMTDPSPKPETTKEMLIRLANQVCESYDFYPYLPQLVQAVIEVESNYRLDVISSAGCIGPMQISPFWQADRMHKLKVTDLTDPYSNILVGVDLLEDLYYNYTNQSIELTLMMYNMDFKSARAIWSSGQVTAYCSKVLHIYDTLKGG